MITAPTITEFYCRTFTPDWVFFTRGKVQSDIYFAGCSVTHPFG